MIKVVPETEEEVAAAQSRPVSIGMGEYYLPGKPRDVPKCGYFPQRGGEIWIHDLLRKSVFSEAVDPHTSNNV